MADFAQPPPIDTTQQQQPKLEESPIPSATAHGATLPAINKDPVFDTPPPSVKPSTDKISTGKSFAYKSPNIKFEDDAPAYLKAKVESLIYWEYPKKSAIFLISSLSILILTQYYSLLQIVAGVFTLTTGLNLAFVFAHKQGQRFIGGKTGDNISNPHSERLETKGTYIPRDRVLRTAQLTIDVVEVITQQITKLILIEDTWRSVISLVVSYMVWTLAKYVSTKYLFGIFVVSAFSLPRLYLQNQELVDAHVARQSKNARVLAEQYGGVAMAKTRELTEQAKTFIKSKSASISKPGAATAAQEAIKKVE
ncbi:Reticulon-domain-containing protein [Parasitella parasitica]|nr:Reticulon-domain-containing protein [Parasitella parasitica]